MTTRLPDTRRLRERRLPHAGLPDARLLGLTPRTSRLVGAADAHVLPSAVHALLLWPVAADGTDAPLLYTERFHFPDGKARLFPVSWTEPSVQPDTEFDLRLNNGRLLEHFHEGNLTYRSEGIRLRTPDTFVEISPELAGERGIQDGTWVAARRVRTEPLQRGEEVTHEGRVHRARAHGSRDGNESAQGRP